MVKPDDMAKLKDRIEQVMRQLPKFDLLKNNITITSRMRPADRTAGDAQWAVLR